MCATFSITGSPSFSSAGEGSQKPCSGGESSWQGTVQPRAVPGQLVLPPQDVPRLQTHAGCQMEPRGDIFWCCLYTKAHGSLISWASSMPRAQAWLLPRPSQTIPFEVRAAGKCQNKARCPSLCISSWLGQLRAELRAVVLSPSGKGRGDLKQVPEVSLFLFGTSETLSATSGGVLVGHKSQWWLASLS